MIKSILKMFGLSYESSRNTMDRMAVIGAQPREAREELKTFDRLEMVRKARFLEKNNGFFREYLRAMDMFSIGDGIRPQAQTSDPIWNKQAEKFFARWSKKPEITGRFSMREVQSMVCRMIDTDGEHFILKVKDQFGKPKLQLVETHVVHGNDPSINLLDGVIYSKTGVPIAYRLSVKHPVDKKQAPYIYDVPANLVMHIFDCERPSCGRVPPFMQHSINDILDVKELLRFEMLAAKDNAEISRVLELDDPDSMSSDFGLSEVTSGTKTEMVEKKLGGRVLGLKKGEKLTAHESNRPSQAFQGFIETLLRSSSGGGLPFEFISDMSKLGGASARAIVAKADRCFSRRQAVMDEKLLTPTWVYVIGWAIANGELPRAKDWADVAWVTPRRVTVDAGREAQQNRSDVEMGLKTLSDHFAEMGVDARDEIERRGQDARLILDIAEKYGVPTHMIFKTSTEQIVSRPNEETDDSETEKEKEKNE